MQYIETSLIYTVLVWEPSAVKVTNVYPHSNDFTGKPIFRY